MIRAFFQLCQTNPSCQHREPADPKLRTRQGPRLARMRVCDLFLFAPRQEITDLKAWKEGKSGKDEKGDARIQRACALGVSHADAHSPPSSFTRCVPRVK